LGTIFVLKHVLTTRQYSKRDEIFILPNLCTGPEVILPMSQIRWLMEQPDHVLSQHAVNREFLHADRTFLHYNIIRDTVHGRVIRRELTKDLDVYAADIVDEIQHALSDNFGNDCKEWKEVALYPTMLDVIARISNRVLVGLPLCRNKEYNGYCSTFLQSVVITAGMMNLLPQWLEPLFAPVLMLYDYYIYWRITRFIFPIVKERMTDFRPGMEYKKPDYSKHNDYIQWALHDAFSHDDPIERTPEMVTRRLAVLSFAAIQSSVITITNTLFDIASSDQAIHIQDVLRTEITTTIPSTTADSKQNSPKKDDKTWTRATLFHLHRTDSALRESMRLWGFISRGVMKKVHAPSGITLPSGHHLPPGAKVGVTAYAIHHDESVFTHAMKYDAFRFSRARHDTELFERCYGGGRDEVPVAPSLVTSSERFMAFSHGRHACPGRFFAANQLKLLLAQVVLRYHVQPLDARPENPWLNNSIGPPMWAKVRVRRRGEGEGGSGCG